jgi:predicted nucleotidyltransferase
MRPSETLRTHRESVLAIAASFGMANVRVFGSISRNEDGEESDIDLLVDAPDSATLLDMVALQNALENELGLPIDVLTVDDLPARFRSQVLAQAKPL